VEDKKLLRLLQRDPDKGMGQLMNQYMGLVCAVVRGRLTGSSCVSTDIEDCVADTFSEFYMGLSDFDPTRACIKSYLCVLARHNAVDLLRRREKQAGELSLDDEDVFLHISEEEALDEGADAELRGAVLQALRSMGEPDASILFRKFYLGETSKEIAAALGLSVSNVDTRTHRALHKLKQMFGGTKSNEENITTDI